MPRPVPRSRPASAPWRILRHGQLGWNPRASSTNSLPWVGPAAADPSISMGPDRRAPAIDGRLDAIVTPLHTIHQRATRTWSDGPPHRGDKRQHGSADDGTA